MLLRAIEPRIRDALPRARNAVKIRSRISGFAPALPSTFEVVARPDRRYKLAQLEPLTRARQGPPSPLSYFCSTFGLSRSPTRRAPEPLPQRSFSLLRACANFDDKQSNEIGDQWVLSPARLPVPPRRLVPVTVSHRIGCVQVQTNESSTIVRVAEMSWWGAGRGC